MNRLFVTLLILCAMPCTKLCAQSFLDLSGAWDLALGDDSVYIDCVTLPGSLLTNDKGDPVTVNTQWTGSLYDSSYYHNPFMKQYQVEGNMKFPFFLTPQRHYVGTAWYRRTVDVPIQWRDERILLFLERPHIETTVFVNGHEVGHQMSLNTPHHYDITRHILAGTKNTIAVRVYNGIEHVGVGQDSHSVTDQTQGNWNGIAGRIELQAHDRRVYIHSVQVFPDIKRRQAKVVVKLSNPTDSLRFIPLPDTYVVAEAQLWKSGQPQSTITSDAQPANDSTITLTLHLGEQIQTWDEFSPAIYHLTVHAGADSFATAFGMREISVDGPHIMLNGHPIWLRGTVENCTFPDTGYPPTDVASWRRIFRKCKDYGLNHMRFHSYCPPEAAFVAADELGFYLQPEGPSWPNHGVKLGNGQVIDTYLMQETQRMVEAYGNHPSFCMMAAGNEPAGNWVKWCNDWCDYWRHTDSRRIYCGASVGGGWQWDEGSDYHVKGGARGLDWSRHAPQTMDDFTADIRHPRNFIPSDHHPINTQPYISHEQGQWCAFPDLKETAQYDGVYKAANFDIFYDLLEANGMADRAEHFLMASGKLQTLCYRMEIERNLRTKDYAGFQLLGLNDYSGQGTALVGPLNVFWREKGYVTSREWRESCHSLVLLAHFPKFVFTPSDTLCVPITLYNAYRDILEPDSLRWLIANDEGVVAHGGQALNSIPRGKENALATITLPLAHFATPAKYVLHLNYGNAIDKHYDFWVYSADAMPTPPRRQRIVLEGAQGNITFYEADSLDAMGESVLREGGTVLLTAAGHVTLGADVRQDYTPVFWNTSWFKMKPPHTTGCHIEHQHPLFRHGFPTDSWANLNWWELLNRAQVMNLVELPKDYNPPIQPIDTWHVSRKLGMLIEARVLGGRLLMTTIDINRDLDKRPVAAQMRRAIIDYIQSADFQPALSLAPQTIRNFFHLQTAPINLFTNDSPDELKPRFLNPSAAETNGGK